MWPAPLHPLNLHYPMGTAVSGLPPRALLANVQFPHHFFSLCANVIFSMRPPLTPLFKIKPSPPTLSLKETCPHRMQSWAEGQPGPGCLREVWGAALPAAAHLAPRACVLAVSSSVPKALRVSLSSYRSDMGMGCSRMPSLQEKFASAPAGRKEK